MLYQYPEAKKQVNFVTFQIVRVQKKKKKKTDLLELWKLVVDFEKGSYVGREEGKERRRIA